MAKEYRIIQNVSENTHSYFNNECKIIDINNFRNNHLMRAIVQNCSKESGLQQYKFICEEFNDIFNKIDMNLIKKYDSIGGCHSNELINGLTPKVYSYIREAIIFCKFYLIPKQINQIENLLIIGGGYGLESCILYTVCDIFGIKINSINGIDMPNVANLQNIYFKEVGMNEICKSYSPDEYKVIPDIVYSNCCLSELTCDINYEYYNNFCSKSKGFYIVWGLWAADIPKYYQPYIVKGKHHELINDGLVSKDTNAIIVK